MTQCFCLKKVAFRADGAWQPQRAALLKTIIHLINDTPRPRPHAPCPMPQAPCTLPAAFSLGLWIVNSQYLMPAAQLTLSVGFASVSG
jgi:hypothetical protein